MLKIVMMTTAPESLKMIGCNNARNIIPKNGDEMVLPMICSKGTKCTCLRGGLRHFLHQSGNNKKASP